MAMWGNEGMHVCLCATYSCILMFAFGRYDSCSACAGGSACGGGSVVWRLRPLYVRVCMYTFTMIP
jgi:hypothetical protein